VHLRHACVAINCLTVNWTGNGIYMGTDVAIQSHWFIS
jgi:hypothetical protein